MNSDESWLLLDIGNSAVKGARLNADGSLDGRFSFRTDRGRFEQLLRSSLGEASAPGRFRRAGVSSVVPELIPGALAVASEFAADAMVVTPALRLNFDFRYETAETFGTDRLCAVAGAVDRHQPSREKTPIVIVMAGTAVTFEVVTGGGAYIGGAIMPGPGVAATALSSGTAQLPVVEFTPAAALIGRSTVEALQAGVFFSVVGGINGYAQRLRDELGDFRGILTGGWAATLQPHLAFEAMVDEDLIFRGMAALMRLNT